MAKFYKLKVSDITKETSDCVSIAFDLNSEIKPEFQYIPGQYLTLKAVVNGEEIRRAYSICASREWNESLRVACKEVLQGKMSGFLNGKLKVGDEIEVMTPLGNFHTELSSDRKKNYILFSGGSGITPIISIIKSVLKIEPKSSIVLFYANRNENSIIFKQQLTSLSNEFIERFEVHHILDEGNTSTPLLSGIMSETKVGQLLDTLRFNGNEEVFVCGPGPMMENVKNVVLNRGIPKDQFHIEYFTSVNKEIETAEKQIKNDGPENSAEFTTSKVTIIIDDEESEIELSPKGGCILDAGIDAGLDLPFACKGAVCCTCKAKVLEGKAEMEQNYALTDDEVEEGFILTCQSHPRSEKLVITYDEI